MCLQYPCISVYFTGLSAALREDWVRAGGLPVLHKLIKVCETQGSVQCDATLALLVRRCFLLDSPYMALSLLNRIRRKPPPTPDEAVLCIPFMR